MTAPPDNTGRDQGGRFRKGRSGNPKGCPAGSRHKATLAAQAILDGECEALTRKAIELALAGEGPALRLCLERILPPRRDRPISFELPSLGTAGDAVQAMTAITKAVAAGELTPSEAGDFSALIGAHVKTIEASELEKRIALLEQRMSDQTRR